MGRRLALEHHDFVSAASKPWLEPRFLTREQQTKSAEGILTNHRTRPFGVMHKNFARV